MAELAIMISDVDDEVEVTCVGDTNIEGKPTPGQLLANKLMEVTEKILEFTEHVPR